MVTTKKDINYVNTTFDQYKDNMLQMARVYYPNTYSDFDESSPGMMFVDMAAMVGDVLSFYLDNRVRESLFFYAQERKSILANARVFGYIPKISTPAVATIDLFQLVPASGSSTAATADLSYALTIKSNSLFRSKVNETVFLLQSDVDFAINNLADPLDISVYKIDETTGSPQYYLLRKSAKVISAEIKSVNYTVGAPQEYLKILIDDENVIGVLDVYDSDNQRWDEVEFLAQDTIFYQAANVLGIDNTLSADNSTVPYLAELKQVPRRFITRVTINDKLELQFGSGVSSSPDEIITPNPDNVGSPLLTGVDGLNINIDPSNFLYTKSYGQAPGNTVLTIRYLVGGGIQANVPAQTITEIIGADIDSSRLPLSNPLLNTQIVNSLGATNPAPAAGGRGLETNEEIRQNAIGHFNAQGRVISREDYIARIYSMPGKFGSIAKAFIIQDDLLTLGQLNRHASNPQTLNCYCLAYDNNKSLIVANNALKYNIKSYLKAHIAMTDGINIKDAYIVNIQVYFDVITAANYNDADVLLRCISALKTYFNIDNWQINQPIILGDIYALLQQIEGVQNVSRVWITNVNNTNLGYSNILYDINTATRRGIVFPSVDPCIFEVKYPNQDIIGRVTTY